MDSRSYYGQHTQKLWEVISFSITIIMRVLFLSCLEYKMIITIIFRVMLTCALRAQVKELKMEIKNKFYIEGIIFATFMTLNA